MRNTAFRLLILTGLVAFAIGRPATAGEPEYVPTPTGDLAQRLDGTLQNLGGNSEVYDEAQPAEGFPTCSTADSVRPGGWFLDGGFEVLHRMKGTSINYIALGQDNSLQSVNTTLPAITFADREFGLAPGARATLGRYIDSSCSEWDRNLEFSFLGGFNFDTKSELDSLFAHQIFSPGATFLGGFNGADSFKTNYRSTFNSFEWDIRFTEDLPRDRMVMTPDGNWHREMNEEHVVSFLFGFRWMNIQEDFSLQSRRNDQDFATFHGDYDIHTKNDMLGVQMGGELIEQHNRWNWGVNAKGGIYANFLAQSSTISTADPNTNLLLVNRNEHSSNTIAAFEGEIGLYGNYQLTRCCTFHAGYDFIFLRGLASAPDQFHFNDSRTNVVYGAYQFLTGGNLGFEVAW